MRKYMRINPGIYMYLDKFIHSYNRAHMRTHTVITCTLGLIQHETYVHVQCTQINTCVET